MGWYRWGWIPMVGLLGACGGGGGGSSAPPPPPPPPPVVQISAPGDLSGGLTGSLTLAASAAGSGIAGVRFQVDGEDLGPEVTAPPYQATFSTSAYATGQHVLRARARDAGGQTSTWATVVVGFGGSVDLPAGFSRSTWTSGLSAATAFAFAPDGRLFVCQQGGQLRVVKNGVLLASPFLTVPVSSAGERGLLGLAFDPAFAANRLVYVYYTAPLPVPHNRISRFRADLGDPDRAEAGSETVLVDLPDLGSATNHNGGALHFGPDGMLYCAVGENAQPALAPSLASPFGKLLRFRPDGTIPPDNPFFGATTGLARAIWAKGLRNPYTFAFQPGTGRLHLNDVGQGAWEEINLGAPGADYGWPAAEGPGGAGTAPLFAYGHASQPAGQPASTGTFLQGIAITGGAFYPSGGPFPAAYAGSYFFADYGSGWIARMDLRNGSDRTAVSTFARVGGNPLDLAVGPDGALYILGRTAVTRITYP